MHSIRGFIARMSGHGPEMPQGGWTRPADDGWAARPPMDVQKFRADQRKQRDASDSKKRESDRKYFGSKHDPRDWAKFGAVEASRPYSTGSKHGTGRGSQA